MRRVAQSLPYRSRRRRSFACLQKRWALKRKRTTLTPDGHIIRESPLRRLFSEVWKEQSGKEFVTEAIHAGLECGLFCDKLPGLDAIAVGAGCTGCHTPDEAMDMTTIEPLYQLVKGVLERIH